MQEIKKTIARFLVLTLLLIVGPASSRAQRTGDSISVSLLTCSPGSMVYELYGHTALRITDYSLATDVVFNYGVFDFDQPHFTWRFMLGQTDYMVQPVPYLLFEDEYIRRGSSIVSQRINLTMAEANDLYNRLLLNVRPENRVYRYNFLTCNCTTQVRDMIESCIQGTVQYKEREKKTYRESLHEFTAGSPWAELGDDLLLGAQTDTVLTDRAAQFLPGRLMEYFSDAVIYDSLNNSRPLVLGDAVVLLEAREMQETKSFPLSPLACGLIFLGAMWLIFGLEYKFKFVFWLFDLLLMPGIGVAGLLVAFMVLFSEHPTVGSNWQVWVLNPLPLFCMPWVVWCAIKRRRCLYHYLNAAILALFLVASPWIPQDFCVITLPLALGLLARPLSYITNSAYQKPKRSKKARR